MIFKYPISRGIKVILGNLFNKFVPIKKDRCAIVAKANVSFSGNLRCIADELLRMGKYEVIIYKDGPIDKAITSALEEAGAQVISGFSFSNLRKILSCEKVFIGHSIRDAHFNAKNPNRTIINLWHGMPMKRIELLMPESIAASSSARRKLMLENAQVYDYVIAGSRADAKVMAKAFGVPLSKVTNTGLPRFDYFTPSYNFPSDLKKFSDRLLKDAGGRKIILYAPTFRENSKSPFAQLDNETVAKLNDFAKQYNCVFALRPHPYDQKSANSMLVKENSCFLDASSKQYPEMATVLVNTDCLITDYSSIWIDYALMKRPILGLMHDYDIYVTKERGFIHDFKRMFPGEISYDWSELLISLSPHVSKKHRSENQTKFDSINAHENSKDLKNLLPQNIELGFTIKLLKQLGF